MVIEWQEDKRGISNIEQGMSSRSVARQPEYTAPKAILK